MSCRFRAFEKLSRKELLTERCITVPCWKPLYTWPVLFMLFCIIVNYGYWTNILNFWRLKSQFLLEANKIYSLVFLGPYCKLRNLVFPSETKWDQVVLSIANASHSADTEQTVTTAWIRRLEESFKTLQGLKSPIQTLLLSARTPSKGSNRSPQVLSIEYLTITRLRLSKYHDK